MRKGPADEARIEAAFRPHTAFQCLSNETLRELANRGLLQTLPNGKWHFGDSSNGCTRYLSGGRWKRADTKGVDWHRLAGLQDAISNDREFVAFVLEGTKDALAAAELLNRIGLLPTTGIVAALGSGYRPIEAEIEQLSGRKVLLIGDSDVAGRDCISRVSSTFCAHKIDHIVLFWPEPVNDLFDLVQAHVESHEDFGRLYNSFFSFFLPSHHSTVQRLNASTVQLLNSSTVQQFNNSTIQLKRSNVIS